MPVNIDEIKKLPDEEKIKLIDELWESIENDWQQEDYEESHEVIQMLEERQAAYDRGEMKFRSWDEVLKELKQNQPGNNQNQSHDKV